MHITVLESEPQAVCYARYLNKPSRSNLERNPYRPNRPIEQSDPIGKLNSDNHVACTLEGREGNRLRPPGEPFREMRPRPII